MADDTVVVVVVAEAVAVVVDSKSEYSVRPYRRNRFRFGQVYSRKVAAAVAVDDVDEDESDVVDDVDRLGFRAVAVEFLVEELWLRTVVVGGCNCSGFRRCFLVVAGIGIGCLGRCC